jgi:hypothetical protein
LYYSSSVPVRFGVNSSSIRSDLVLNLADPCCYFQAFLVSGLDKSCPTDPIQISS